VRDKWTAYLDDHKNAPPRWPSCLRLIAFTVRLVVMDRGPLAQSNPTSIENGRLTGVADASQWDVNGAGDLSIQGFAPTSRQHRWNDRFKINTPSMNYHIDIYRLGYYANGAGRRKIATIALPRRRSPKCSQRCLNDSRRACTTAGIGPSARRGTPLHSGWTRDLRHLCPKLIRDDWSSREPHRFRRAR